MKNKQDHFEILRKIVKLPAASQRDLAKELGFSLGNTVKYISRAGKKGKDKELEDLRKALWYLEHHIKTLEEKNRS